jgi:hypothetical protein
MLTAKSHGVKAQCEVIDFQDDKWTWLYGMMRREEMAEK